MRHLSSRRNCNQEQVFGLHHSGSNLALAAQLRGPIVIASAAFSRLRDNRWPAAALLCWIPVAAALGALAFIVYAAVQQDIRQSANYPQVALAESAARRLAAGEPPAAILPVSPVEMQTSLDPFVIVYDDQGNVRASTVSLDGRTPAVPPRVFDAVGRNTGDLSLWASIVASSHGLLLGEKPCCLPGVVRRPGELRFTWQPQPGVRAASVLTSYDGHSRGYVLVGRSLREVEMLEDHIFAVVALGLAGGLAITLVAALAVTAIAAWFQTGPLSGPSRTESIGSH
jgi:hypothetical protein